MYGPAAARRSFRGTRAMRSVWIKSVLIAGLSISAGSMLANASETPKTDQTTPTGQSSTATPSNSSDPIELIQSSSQTTSNPTNESTKTTPSGKTYQNYPSYPDRYTDEGDSVSTRHTSEHRSYRVVHRRSIPPCRTSPRRIPPPACHLCRAAPLSSGLSPRGSRAAASRRAGVLLRRQLVGRDPDANVRLMILKDNARTMWAR